MGSGSPRDGAGRKRIPRGCVFPSCFPLPSQLLGSLEDSNLQPNLIPVVEPHSCPDVHSGSCPGLEFWKWGRNVRGRVWDQALEDMHLLPRSKLSKILQLPLLSLRICPGPLLLWDLMRKAHSIHVGCLNLNWNHFYCPRRSSLRDTMPAGTSLVKSMLEGELELCLSPQFHQQHGCM